jgi:hypothetical protein
MIRKYTPALGIICLLLMAGCSRSFEVIRDIRELPQDHFHYISKASADRDLVSAEDLIKLQNHYNNAFFFPWRQDQSQYGRSEAEAFFTRYLNKLNEGGEKQKHNKAISRRLMSNARLDRYPNKALRAITLRHTDMRGLPSHRIIHSSGRSAAGRNSAFDRLQVSSIPANTPVFISHLAKDKKWCLAETGYAFGWLMIRDLGIVDADFMSTWENGTYAAFIKDHAPIYVGRHRFFKGSIGSLFPKVGEAEDAMEILVAVPGKKGRAAIRNALVLKTQAVSSPHTLNLHHIGALANEFMDNPYGWGGKDEKRDCSSMIRDLFTPFGIWLPRHSSDQASQGGYYIDLSGQSREEKKTMIMSQGIPYLTLLWLKGHIMIYIGAPGGEPLVFHNFWSVRTMDIEGRSGKKIVGRTAITTLHPGKEFQPPGSTQGDILKALQGMTLLTFSTSPNSVVKQKTF